MQSPIVQFYDLDSDAPSGEDHLSDYKLRDILKWNSSTLEARHDYIQHLFPLPEPSPFNSGAATLTKHVRDEFHARPELRLNLLQAFNCMCVFYGFAPNFRDGDFAPGKLEALPRGAHFAELAHSWGRHFDHNHLRMTRIIRSIRILGLEAEARMFYETLVRENVQLGNVINQRSLGLWRHAAYGPLHIPPSDNDPVVVRGASTRWSPPSDTEHVLSKKSNVTTRKVRAHGHASPSLHDFRGKLHVSDLPAEQRDQSSQNLASLAFETIPPMVTLRQNLQSALFMANVKAAETCSEGTQHTSIQGTRAIGLYSQGQRTQAPKPPMLSKSVELVISSHRMHLGQDGKR
nr:opioid growth factor receptor [Quercus suber]